MKRLREILKEKNIKYSQVADALGIHPNHLKRYDDLTKRSIEEVLIISKATGIEFSELLGLDESKNIKIGHSTHGHNSPVNGNINATINSDVEIAKKEIEFLKQRLSDKEELIELLKKNQR